ncbi:helicase-related protein [Actinoplanes regularis]|uniref:SNF2 family N-terminal domain-containing protein n=1 Tax=Actinoplanes regularis TaxID=52697 RepID=A0A238XJ57_9ACTN|nr:helicase-related protein [Actinoplanes regularis]GIE90489.1 ATP-dependent helicase HepA [Actinoplanes regularis]SNR58611.1 SNF2 family N-terminal domain-containing protein [Actinoplanes regularis]
MTMTVGSLVRARGREWVVLPGSDDEFLVLRPLGGGDDDIAGVFTSEGVEPAQFAPPRADDLGDDRSARLLRDALRIGFRSSGGPFRSLAGLAVDPRPYQLVPLLLALRQDPVRLLIADDVGVGKTVEAGLIAAELLAQGSIDRLAVLCPPSLAEQWRDEMDAKFGLKAELVLPSTVRRLERGLRYGQSVFERHPITIVSTDFIKADNRRDDFLRAAPELVIVDEAHASVCDDTTTGKGRTQRYRLVKDLAATTGRHLILVTATPHSGNDGAFRNLIGLLNPALHGINLATDHGRRLLATHMVQRRRGDIRSWLAETKFPKDRRTGEDTYLLSPAYRALFDDVLAYARGQITDVSGSRLQQRVRWWSVLSLLRALASSPAAAAATLATRAAAAGADTAEHADRVSAPIIFELTDDESLDDDDAVPGALYDDEAAPVSTDQAMLRDFRDRAAAIATETDPAARAALDTKLALVTETVAGLLKDRAQPGGYHPIVFCRFVATADYVAAHLRDVFKKAVVEVVTGDLPPEERAARVRALAVTAGTKQKILVATDCLSEGVNLQDDFQAVVHYDLAWNPTRHEQREGRVDRFGQPAPIVRAVTLYGADNGIDSIIMDVLIRKHEAIRRDLGISVPVPANTDKVLTALMENVLRRGDRFVQETLDFDLPNEAKQLEIEWQSSAEEEKRSRSRYAHHSIAPDEVQREVDASRLALGSPDDVTGFVRTALHENGGTVTPAPYGFAVETGGLPVGLQDALGNPPPVLSFHTDLPAPRTAGVLVRTDPKVAAIARYVLDAALDDVLDERQRPARRCGVVVTNAVTTMTVALLTRFRVHLTLPGRDGPRPQVAEEARVLAFTGKPSEPTWLTPAAVEDLLAAQPDANMPHDIARNTMGQVLEVLPTVVPHLDQYAHDLAESLREAHVRVRTTARGDRAGALSIRGLTVEPQLPVDVLGVYVYLPGAAR